MPTKTDLFDLLRQGMLSCSRVVQSSLNLLHVGSAALFAAKAAAAALAGAPPLLLPPPVPTPAPPLLPLLLLLPLPLA